jgi:hypothetical protein
MCVVAAQIVLASTVHFIGPQLIFVNGLFSRDERAQLWTEKVGSAGTAQSRIGATMVSLLDILARIAWQSPISVIQFMHPG